MDRTEAARVLGVGPGASARQVERAFRAAVRRTHPDQYPPGSEAWEDASAALRALTEARTAWYAAAPDRRSGPHPGTDPGTTPSGVRVAGRTDAGDLWAWAEDAPPPPEWVIDEAAIQRRRRTWGYAWGGFLLASAGLSLVVGARPDGNVALPLWAPALAITGIVALVLGRRAARALRR
jgi:hypothetical protein